MINTDVFDNGILEKRKKLTESRGIYQLNVELSAVLMWFALYSRWTIESVVLELVSKNFINKNMILTNNQTNHDLFDIFKRCSLKYCFCNLYIRVAEVTENMRK